VSRSSQLQAEYLELQRRMKEVEEELSSKGRAVIEDFAKTLFEKWGARLESFGWTQYTPYFNDGSECVFGTYSDYPSINGEESYYSTYDPTKNTWEDEAGREVSLFLGEIPDETFKALFGDHAEITVTREGIRVADYLHD
jgi:hypothetical protein